MIKLRFLRYVLPWGAVMLAGVSSLSAQTEVVFSVVSTAGGAETVSIDGRNYTCSWNIGEPLTETFGSYPGFDASKKRLTQGFEQGEGFIEDPFAQELGNEGYGEGSRTDIRVFPNPVRQHLNVVLPEEAGKSYSLCLRNLHGGSLYARREAGAGSYGLDMTRLPAGVYVLDVETGNSCRSFKIVKVQ